MLESIIAEMRVFLNQHVHHEINKQHIESEFNHASEIASQIARACEYSLNDVEAWKSVSNWYTVSAELADVLQKDAEEIIFETPYGFVWGHIRQDAVCPHLLKHMRELIMPSM
ncbi:hypothetical protein [Desulfopila aestuarii]|uniref:Uncharacterized protein n=1 Tax=Desulfopila aestuarii DSM 18488 TaxID=1121416 RepID=A0A1M7YGM0_9BACT|nr:hypothetical protein [Desulfopila aestuarii]SHO51743.1 hypothetical protein SAMN02745220_04205 [Desulfopila aestuarii DSM 18488]